jgi:hypothetical protein
VAQGSGMGIANQEEESRHFGKQAFCRHSQAIEHQQTSHQ